jgi:thiol-disulfide isomerase/thioredoxin
VVNRVAALGEARVEYAAKIEITRDPRRANCRAMLTMFRETFMRERRMRRTLTLSMAVIALALSASAAAPQSSPAAPQSAPQAASQPASQSGQKAAAIPLEKRPFVLVVYADWCPYCQDLKPVLALLNDKYRGRIRFVRYDITSDETSAKSKEMAAKLGLTKFFDGNEEKTSLVMILDSSRHEVFRATSDDDAKHYEAVLDQQLQNVATR